MAIDTDFAGKSPFEVVAPVEHRLPLVFNSPHSGSMLPRPFPRRLAPRQGRHPPFRGYLCRRAVHAGAVRLGAPLLKANFPRAWLDVNREPYELDPKMFAGSLPTYANVRSVRVAGGLGTIARIVSESEEIYARPLAVEEALDRIDGVYKPYHRTLRQLVLDTHATSASRCCSIATRCPRPCAAASSRLQARHRARRSLRHELRAGVDRPRRANPHPARLFGQPQQALCRRLHHRTLRPTGARPPCHPDRDQPQPLYGRAHAGAHQRLCPPVASTSPARRTSLAEAFDAGFFARPKRRSERLRSRKRKRAAREARRPKSREETPKEGMRYRYRTAIT